MVTHHRHQHFARKLQVLRIERAEDGRGELGYVNESLEQVGVGLHLQLRRGGHLGDAVSIGAAVVGREHDAVLRERLLVTGDGYLDRLLAELAMSAGQVAGLHAGDFKRDHVVAQQRDDPADGPDEARTALARPVHGLRPLDSQNEAGERFRQNVRRCPALDLFAECEILAFGCGLDRELVRGDAVLARESIGCAFAGGLRRTDQQVLGVGLPVDQLLGAQGQATRRGIYG